LPEGLKELFKENVSLGLNRYPAKPFRDVFNFRKMPGNPKPPGWNRGNLKFYD
jgi:hypothetical protein